MPSPRHAHPGAASWEPQALCSICILLVLVVFAALAMQQKALDVQGAHHSHTLRLQEQHQTLQADSNQAASDSQSSAQLSPMHAAQAALASFRTTRAAEHPNEQHTLKQSIPPIIHQVYGLFGDGPPPSKVEFYMNSFKVLNPNHTHIVWGPQDLDAMVQQYWPAYWSTYSQLQMPVLKADLARYMLVSTFGGVYSDVDTVCLKPVNDWGDGRSSIGMIIGIEVDAHGVQDWQKFWGRELQFCQWTFAAAPSHPLLSMVIHRSFQLLAAAGDVRSITDAKRVCDLTGPYLFTDVVDQYLQQQGYDWRQLLGHNKEELVGDLYILSITGFSPGVGHMGAGNLLSQQAKVQHQFHGNWKGEAQPSPVRPGLLVHHVPQNLHSLLLSAAAAARV